MNTTTKNHPIIKYFFVTFTILVISSVLSVRINGQMTRQDSLWQVVQNAHASDVARSNALFHWLIPQQFKLSTDSLAQYFELLHQFAQRSQNAISMSQAAVLAHFIQQQTSNSIQAPPKLALQALQLSKQQNIYPNQYSIKILKLIAQDHSDFSKEYHKTIEYLMEAVHIINTKSAYKANSADVFNVYSTLGVFYGKLKEYHKAIGCNSKCR